MNVNLLKRRQKMLELRGKGVSLADTVKFLAEEFEVTRRTLYYDWKNRKAWLQTFLEIGDPETFFLDLVANHREIYRLASLEYLKGDNSNAKIGALRLLRDLNKDFHEMIVTKNVIVRLENLEEKAKRGVFL